MLGRRNNKVGNGAVNGAMSCANAVKPPRAKQAGRVALLTHDGLTSSSHHHYVSRAACGFVYHTDVTENFLSSRVSRVASSESEAGSFFARARLCAADAPFEGAPCTL